MSTLKFPDTSTNINTPVHITDELVDKIVSKLGSNVNIQFNQSVNDDPSTKIKKLENIKLPEIESSDDDNSDSSSDDNTSEEFSIPHEMKKLGNNILNEYTKEEIDESDNVKETKVKLNKNDTDLIDLLG